jgi:peptidoglycan hydrolase FlgJ
MNSVASLSIDASSLDQLKREAGRDPKAAAKKAATQFEAMFLQMVLKSMRDATPQSGFLQDSSNQMFNGMLDSQISQKLASKGMGLAQAIERQLTNQMKTVATGDGGMPIAMSLDRLRDQLTPPDGKLTVGKGFAAADVVAPAPPNTSNLSASQREFVQQLWVPAQVAEKSTGIPALFIIGQAALETGWGKHQIKDSNGNFSFNLFGIKAGASWQGAKVSATTAEYLDGKRVKVVANFRAYSSYGESVQDWANLMRSNPRYSRVLKTGGSAAEFAQGLQRAGYATDPAYADKLNRVIDRAMMVRKLVV